MMRKTIYPVIVLAISALVLTGAGCAKKSAVPGVNESGGQNAGQEGMVGKKSTDQQAVIDNTKTATGTIEEFVGSMADLLKRGAPLHCSYTITEKNTKIDTVIYVANNKIRSDIEMAPANMPKQIMHSITLGYDQYTWGLQGNKGTKITLTPAEQKKLSEQQAKTGEQSAGAVDLNKKIKYRCGSWRVDNSVFEPPKDIQFEDMTKFFKDLISGAGAGGNINTGNLDLCSICDNLPAGEAKDACQKANCKVE